MIEFIDKMLPIAMALAAIVACCGVACVFIMCMIGIHNLNKAELEKIKRN